jgi:hypothetical protein
MVYARFIQPDTIVPNPGDPQSLNHYSYAGNNPLRYVDPSGHDPIDSYYFLLDFGHAMSGRQCLDGSTGTASIADAAKRANCNDFWKAFWNFCCTL